MAKAEYGRLSGTGKRWLRLREKSRALRETWKMCELKAQFQARTSRLREFLALGFKGLTIKPCTSDGRIDVRGHILDEMAGKRNAFIFGGTSTMRENTNDGCGESALKIEISESDIEVFKRLSVIVVDDSASMLHVLKDFLSRMGFGKVTPAKNGEEAWSLIQGQGKFDLVISDWKMPRLSGIELLDKVRKESATPAVPFVLVTSEAKTDSILTAGKHSATGYIVKPFCFAEFVVAIRQIFADKTSD